MRIDMNGVIYSLSYALDCIEAEVVGVSVDHAKWVAFLATAIGRKLGLSTDALSDLAACAALHDNALTEYFAEERNKDGSNILGEHCRLGERNVRDFPFRTDTSGFILYHHENADGSGPFGKLEQEIPLQSHIIHLADMADVDCRFHETTAENYANILHYLQERRDTVYPGKVIDAFLSAMPQDRYLALSGKSIDDILADELPHENEEYDFSAVKAVMDVFGRIVDFKSVFTRNHSEQIADKVYKMSQYYGYDTEISERLYVAGVLHDIGKMAIKNDILEKPDKLTTDEFAYMKNHAWYTHVILGRIKGFEDIDRFASNHHEKLNGTGYPLRKTGDMLDSNERLMACADIYQALREDRPYKPGMTHDATVAIMRSMAAQGFIDAAITDDFDRVFAGS